MVGEVDTGVNAPKQKKTGLSKKPLPFKPEIEPEEQELLGPIDEEEIENMLQVSGVEIKKKLTQRPMSANAKSTKPTKTEKFAKPKIEVKPKLKKIPTTKSKPESRLEQKTETKQPEPEIALSPPTNMAKIESQDLNKEIKNEEIKHLELAPSQPLPPELQQRSASEDKSSFVKWFLFGVILVAIVMGSYFFFYSILHSNSNVQELPKTGLAVYEPTDLLAGWTIAEARTNLAQIPSDLRANWLTQGVVDGALWHYTRGEEDTFVWIRIYPDRKTLENNDKEFWNALNWLSASYVGIGDRARIGLYRGDPTAYYPLMIYVDKNNTMLYIAYYNHKNKAYNATDEVRVSADKRFLLGLAKGMLAKMFEDESTVKNDTNANNS
ncbi:MAG: hypothetical protein QW063_00675 [Candidatus Nanoarchaeia archaeon]